jgi:hypothetical protein
MPLHCQTRPNWWCRLAIVIGSLFRKIGIHHEPIIVDTSWLLFIETTGNLTRPSPQSIHQHPTSTSIPSDHPSLVHTTIEFTKIVKNRGNRTSAFLALQQPFHLNFRPRHTTGTSPIKQINRGGRFEVVFDLR